MAVYFITGKLGSGKSLVSVGKIFDYLDAGKTVATNLDIYPDKYYLSPNKRSINLIRLPDHPDITDLDAIGRGRPPGCKDERLNSLLVLDECATWFNAQDWQNSKNKAIINWFLHARKLGWDILFIVQDIDLINGQARKGLAEHTAFCQRLDRIGLPFITPILGSLGINIRLPQVHLAGVYLGTSHQGVKTDTWLYRGKHLYKTYDTEQIFDPDYQHGTFCKLTPWHLRGRYLKPRTWRYYMRLTKIVFRKYSRVMIAAASMLAGSSATYATFLTSYTPEQVQIDDLKKQIADLTVRLDTSAPVETPSNNISNVHFTDIVYTGFATYENKISFYFDHPEFGAISSDHPIFEGYTIRPVSSCFVKLTSSVEQHLLTCLRKNKPAENSKQGFIAGMIE